MKKYILLLVGLIVLVGCNTKSDDVINIGVIQFAKHSALDQSYEGFVAALNDNGYKDGENIKLNFNNAQGDFAVVESIASKLVNDNSDLIYAIATPSAQAVANKTSEIPILISAVTDPENSGLVKSNEKPGTNVSGVSDLTPVKEQIEILRTLLPQAKTVAIMYASSEDNSKIQAEMAKAELEKHGIAYIDASVSDMSEIEQVAQSLVNKVDAVYMPTDNLMAEGIQTVTMVLNERNIPSIVGEKGMTIGGGLASDALDYYNLGYLAGEQAVKILKGEVEISDMPIGYLSADEREIVINKTVAEQLNIIIPEILLDVAIIVE